MSEQRPEIDLERSAYRQAFDRPLASPKHLRLAFSGFLAFSVVVAAIAAWLQQWWMPFCVIPIAMWAGASLAGLWPNFFFGSDPSKDDKLI